MRPWSKLIARYPDGIILVAVYTDERGWFLHSNYRGSEKTSIEINALAKSHIDKLPADILTKITNLPTINLQVEQDKFYKGKGSSINYDSYPADGAVKSPFA